MEVWIRYLHWCVLVSIIYKVGAQCGTTNIDASETYKSHTLQYPSSGTYGQDLNCSWIIQFSSNKLLLYLTVSGLANGDVLYIYDGMTTAGSSLYSSDPSGVSGFSITAVAHSGASHIRFTSNGVGGSGQLGFTVRYMSGVTDDKGGCASPVNVEALDTIQFLTSPNFPSKYPSNSDCSWTISSKDNCGSLVLDFYLLDIETNCGLDRVSVTYDGKATIELCPSNDWNSASDYNTTGTTADIALITDSSEQYQGFVMSYMRTECIITTTGTEETTTDVTTGPTVQATSTTTTAGITTATETQSSTTLMQTNSIIANTNSSTTEHEYIGVIVKVVIVIVVIVVVVVPVVAVLIFICVVALKKNNKIECNA